MKRNLLLVVLAAALVGAAHPVWGDSAVIAVPAGMGTPIISLPATISQPGFYYFKRNLSTTLTDSAITINASGVTLDLMGFTLTGPAPGSGTGICTEVGMQYVEVRNGQIKNFYFGIYNYGGGTNHRFANLKVSGCVLGIYGSAQETTITECQARGNFRGIESGATGAVIDQNTASDNYEYGFVVNDVKGMVTNNVATGNGYGFWLGASSGQLVNGNASVQNAYGNWNNLGGCTVGLNTPP